MSAAALTFPPQSPETLEYRTALRANRVCGFAGANFLTIPGTAENDELLGDYCLLNSLCDRYGYRLTGACIVEKGDCPPYVSCGTVISFKYLPNPSRFWIRDDFKDLNPVPAGSRLACVLREAFNDQLLAHLNRLSQFGSGLFPPPFSRVKPELKGAA